MMFFIIIIIDTIVIVIIIINNKYDYCYYYHRGQSRSPAPILRPVFQMLNLEKWAQLLGDLSFPRAF